MTPRKKPEDKLKTGRPTKYTHELALEFCAEISKGLTLSKVLKEHPDWPDRDTWREWNITRPEFSLMYARAHENQVLAMVDYILAKAEDDSRDVIEDEIITEGDDGEMKHKVIRKSDNTAVQRDRLIVDSLKWYSSKVYSKVFGDKIQQEVTGKDGEPFTPVLNITIQK